jgi:hypothetical protein
MIESETLTPEALLSTSKESDFHASWGANPHDLKIEDGVEPLTSSAVGRPRHCAGPPAPPNTVSGRSMTKAGATSRASEVDGNRWSRLTRSGAATA